MPDQSASTPAPAPADPQGVQTRVLLAMFHAARDRGDRAEAERCWHLILAAEWPRVRGLVGTFATGPAVPGNLIPHDERDDVAMAVFVRLHGKIDSLQGRSPGELRAYLRTATGFAVRDWVRAYVARDQHHAGSLDAEAGSPAATGEDVLARLAAELAADDDAGLIARERVHEALAEVEPEKRLVLVRDLKGYSTAETMEFLGLSRDAVYQRRRRGLKELGDAIRELAEEDGS